MTTKWITSAFSGKGSSSSDAGAHASGALQLEESTAQEDADSGEINMKNVDLNKFVVILLYGKNNFGDKIYSYLKITLGGIEKLKAAVLVGITFNPNDFGTVIAAGKGEPTDEVRAEISSQYMVLTTQSGAASAPIQHVAPEAKKNWDEY